MPTLTETASNQELYNQRLREIISNRKDIDATPDISMVTLVRVRKRQRQTNSQLSDRSIPFGKVHRVHVAIDEGIASLDDFSTMANGLLMDFPPEVVSKLADSLSAAVKESDPVIIPSVAAASISLASRLDATGIKDAASELLNKLGSKRSQKLIKSLQQGVASEKESEVSRIDPLARLFMRRGLDTE